MADEDKKDAPKADQTNISPAPAVNAGGPPGDAKTPDAKDKDDKDKLPTSGPQPDPLPDGTVPTVLSAGESHRSVTKSKASLTTIYRRADILTTLLTFGGALVAALIILGIYAFATRNEAKTKTPTLSNKVTNLSAADLSKLNDFFGGNTAGNSSEVLTVNSSSLFDGRVAVNSDLKVTGGADVSGSTTLADLSVNGTSTLGVTGIRGQLTVSGPTTLQGAAVLAGGLTVTGNVTASGNGSFGGSLAAGTINALTLNVNSALNLSSHLNTNGASPSASGAQVVGGDDEAGELASVSTQATITFHSSYSKLPVVMLTPTSPCDLTHGSYYVQYTGGSGFILFNPSSSSDNCQQFNYWVVQ